MELPVEEWNLLPLVYKYALGNRRAAWRVITSVEQKETSKGEEQLVPNAREYVEKVEGELQKIRDGILALMDNKLVPSVNTDETKVSYYRMTSDYFRYLAEFATGETKSKVDEDALDACVEAHKIAENDLAVTRHVRLAMALNTSVFQSEVFQNSDEASQMARVAFEDATTAPVIDIPAVTQQIPIDQIVQKTIEIRQLRCIGSVIDIPVVEVVQVPQAHVAEKTVEITQLDVVEKIVETPEIQTGHGIQDRIQQRTVEQIVDVPVQQVVEEQAPKVFSQNRFQHGFRGQTAETPAISLAEKTVEMPDTRTQDKTQHVVNTHVQHVVNTVEAEKPIINEKINQVTKHVEIPQLQIVEKTIETSKIQTIQGTRTSESCGTAPVCQMTQVRHVEVKSRTSSRDYDTGRTAGIHEDISADRPKAQMSTSIVQELKSKFEAKQKGSQVPTVQRVQKTVEVPRVQYIDKVADILLDVQRQGSTNQAPQYIDEVVDVPVPTQIPDTDDMCLHETADEDGLEHENKERKTLIVNIASGDEAEDDTAK